MGTCWYYLKARFKDREAAEKAQDRVKKMGQEINLLRDRFYGNKEGEAYLETKYNGMRKDFPELFKDFGLPEDVHSLEGVTDLLEMDRYLDNLVAFPIDPDDVNVFVVENVFHLSGEESHLANWDGLSKAMENLGALKVDWTSEEFVDIFDALVV